VTSLSDHEWKSRRSWERGSDEYQRRHGPQLNTRELGWGTWSIPDDELGVLGEVAGRDILELGCGGGQWSMFLRKRGARAVGIDLAARQLWHARRITRELGIAVPLVQGSAERLPFGDEHFDIVFCDHGAMSFADPERTVPEAARVLRPGGRFAFNMTTPLMHICWSEETQSLDECLHATYFGMRRFDDEEDVEFQLGYGDWIRLFRRSGLAVDDLIELRPPVEGSTTYTDFAPRSWSERWPSEHIWVLTKQDRP
jgi:SAM-dependent methyltransferase